MKNRTIKLTAVTAIGFLILIFSSTNLWAEDEAKPSASADVSVFSQYIWRGYELSKDSVVIQPSITVGYKDVSLNLWGNLDTNVYSDTRDEAQFNETDLTLSYDKSFGIVSMGVGYIYYALHCFTPYIYRKFPTCLIYISLDISHSFNYQKITSIF